MKNILSIAGSDCCAGAGIQADLKTGSALGVYCTTVITAVTAQNHSGVFAVRYVGDDLLREQLRAVLDAIRPDAVKIGMLPCASCVDIVADFIESYHLRNVVIDPVLAATSGGSLAGGSESDLSLTIQAMIGRLFPLATLVTPNLPELHILKSQSAFATDMSTETIAAEYAMPEWVLIKGGHSCGDLCIDRLLRLNNISSKATKSAKDEKAEDYGCELKDWVKESVEFCAKRIDSCHTHGTGCTLSSAIACHLAMGYDMKEAVAKSKDYITACIKRGVDSNLFPYNGPVLQQ